MSSQGPDADHAAWYVFITGQTAKRTTWNPLPLLAFLGNLWRMRR